jgi:predicted CXXCH cytochrome family protein
MHNSQDGTLVGRNGTGTGWTGDGGTLTGGSKVGPQGNLLVTDCVGCHSSTNSDTIITIGSSNVPIVYNTSAPSNPLAGGNFYWVENNGDEYGHNVYGISDMDATITETNLGGAPGNVNCGAGSGSSCHYTLAKSNEEAYQLGPIKQGGCQGCHYYVFHHTDNDAYRFLNGHEGGPSTHYVEGAEDDDWEQETSTDHNWYKGVSGPVNGGTLDTTRSISTFCSGCHMKFHREAYIGDASPWLRHPVDIALPQGDGSEYASYDLSDYGNYSAEAPVAWTTPKQVNKGTPIVMCLSCHRPHGSDQPDMLRWDYDDMIVGTSGAVAGTGCFTCHTGKDGVP